jgi:putative chitinase
MLLKIGSKGEDVKKLQSKLGLSPDGVFGPGTEAKVKEWQKANGLGTDGIVGPGTWNKMFVTLAPVSESVKSQTTTGSQSSPALKLDKLKGHVPDSVIAEIPDTAAKFGITTPLRLAHLLAQASHESGHFKSVTENLNYSADGLKKIFPKYFPGNLNESYARNPQKIANKVYSSRMGNGDEANVYQSLKNFMHFSIKIEI